MAPRLRLCRCGCVARIKCAWVLSREHACLQAGLSRLPNALPGAIQLTEADFETLVVSSDYRGMLSVEQY